MYEQPSEIKKETDERTNYRDGINDHNFFSTSVIAENIVENEDIEIELRESNESIEEMYKKSMDVHDDYNETISGRQKGENFE